MSEQPKTIKDYAEEIVDLTKRLGKAIENVREMGARTELELMQADGVCPYLYDLTGDMAATVIVPHVLAATNPEREGL